MAHTNTPITPAGIFYNDQGAFNPLLAHFQQQRLAIRHAQEINLARRLYFGYMRHADTSKQGLYLSPNILERRMTLGVEILQEESPEEPGTMSFYLTSSVCQALSDALAQVCLIIGTFVGYPDWEELECGPDSAPLYEQFVMFNIAYPSEPTNMSHDYMVTKYFTSYDEACDYVVERQVWAMFMISALHCLAMAKGWTEYERLKLPAEYEDHVHIALHLLADCGMNLIGPLAPHTPPIEGHYPVTPLSLSPTPQAHNSDCSMASATPICSFEAQKVTPHVQMLFPWKEETLDQSMHTQSESTSESTVAEEEDKEEDDYESCYSDCYVYLASNTPLGPPTIYPSHRRAFCYSKLHMESRVVYGEDEDAIGDGVGCRLVIQDEGLDDDLMETEEMEGTNEANGKDCQDELEAETEGELVQIRSENLRDGGVLLDPDWSIAIEPTAPHTTCDEIVKRYGASEIVLRTNEWLHESIEAGILPLPIPDHSLCSVGTGNFDTVLFLAKPKESGIRHE
ncbi:hypothetical protein RSOL_168070, partial [Rhizoctonia solani AG-3 Rhs1AP]